MDLSQNGVFYRNLLRDVMAQRLHTLQMSPISDLYEI